MNFANIQRGVAGGGGIGMRRGFAANGAGVRMSCDQRLKVH